MAPADPGSELPKITVDLEPIGRRVRVPPGTSLLDAARLAGVDLVASCGGMGICGTCLVRVISGEVSPLNPSEEETMDSAQKAAGLRLACQALTLADVRLDIPASSLTGGQIMQVEGESTGEEFAPLVKPFEFSCPPPSMEDLRSDLTRVQDALEEAGHPPLREVPERVSEVSTLLRQEGWKARLALKQDGGHSRLAGSLTPGRQMLGLAMDIGSTKVALYLVDLESAVTLAAWGLMNPQIAYGEDVISRIAYANHGDEQRNQMQKLLVEAINVSIAETCDREGLCAEQIVDVTAVGNTAMHHFFTHLAVEPLGRAPYVPIVQEALSFEASGIGLNTSGGACVYMPPNIAGYVGADHVSALVASREHFKNGPALLVDIGTNTEISLVQGERILSCSCASGPAFEGAHIRDGMRAAPGAIERVHFREGGFRVHTILDQPPVGICGSGILNALGEMLEAGILDRRGLFEPSLKGTFVLVPAAESGHGRDIIITRKDVNEIQLAKAAIRGGIETLLASAGMPAGELACVVVAGAFGTHLDLRSAIRVGMFPDLPLERFRQVGNAAGVGARQMLLSTTRRREAEAILGRVEYLELTVVPNFTRLYTNSMYFPEPA